MPALVRRVAWLLPLLLLAACGGSDSGTSPQPTCSVYYDGAYEPATPAPDPAAAPC